MTRDEVREITGPPREVAKFEVFGWKVENWIFEHALAAETTPTVAFNVETGRVIQISVDENSGFVDPDYLRAMRGPQGAGDGAAQEGDQ